MILNISTGYNEDYIAQEIWKMKYYKTFVIY